MHLLIFVKYTSSKILGIITNSYHPIILLLLTCNISILIKLMKFFKMFVINCYTLLIDL